MDRQRDPKAPLIMAGVSMGGMVSVLTVRKVPSIWAVSIILSTCNILAIPKGLLNILMVSGSK